MKVWCGIEKEGFRKGCLTYFIEEMCLSRGTLRKVKKLIQQPGALYFGAGEKDFKRISNKFLDDLKQFKQQTGNEIIFEMNLKNYLKYSKKLQEVATIVWRINSNDLSLKRQLKVRQNNEIYVFNRTQKEFNQITNEELSKMYYKDDKILLED